MNSSIIYKELPHLMPNPATGMYTLIKSLRIVYKTDEGEIRAVLIPKGYETDGASIPEFFWNKIGTPFNPKFILAAIVHDYHCNILDGDIKISKTYEVSVDEISDLFFDLLISDGVGFSKAWSMEQAVRLYKTFFFKGIL